jgi:hypothetical protein
MRDAQPEHTHPEADDQELLGDQGGQDRYGPDPDSRAVHPAEDRPQHSRVADLRAVAAPRGRDTEVAVMVAELGRRSEQFTALFSEGARQRLLWFRAPPGIEAAAQLELLSVIGIRTCPRTTRPRCGRWGT